MAICLPNNSPLTQYNPETQDKTTLVAETCSKFPEQAAEGTNTVTHEEDLRMEPVVPNTIQIDETGLLNLL